MIIRMVCELTLIKPRPYLSSPMVKMEITVLAPRAGVVHEVLCSEGQPVTAGQPLVLLR